jgi:adenosylmethionine-8-amino-7-oxononanoate aminotransferase
MPGERSKFAGERIMPLEMKAPASNYNTEEIWRKDRDHFLHPWTHFESFKKDGSLVVAEGSDAYIIDSRGKRYLDGIGSLWSMGIGYGRNEMADAIAEQVRRLPFFNTFVDTTNPPAAELAAKLAELAPGSLNRVAFACTGSDANDTAVRLTHYYHARRGNPQKRHIISRKDAYHGSTYLGMSLTGRSSDRSSQFHYITDIVHHVSSPYVYRRPEGMTPEQFCDFLVNELEQTILELGPENTAAFIAEPILGAGGVLVPPLGYHGRTRELCRKYDMLYISDEVVTAFGRLGHWFASKDVFGIEPDIIVTAKGISSGYIPLAATIFSDAIYDVIAAPDPDAWFTHGFTYSGHPVACVAGLKNIEIMEREDLCGHVRKVGPYLEKRLRDLYSQPIVGDVRGRNFMMCTEYVADKKTKAVFGEGVAIGKRISNYCEELGLIVRPLEHLNIMSPPLILTEAQVDEMVDKLEAGIRATVDSLVRDGHRIG